MASRAPADRYRLLRPRPSPRTLTTGVRFIASAAHSRGPARERYLRGDGTADGYSRTLVDALDLRGEFPVLEQSAYLNAGTDGPLPARAVRAAREELERELSDGRTGAHFERRAELGAR